MQVLGDLGDEYSDVVLISMHSISKGFYGAYDYVSFTLKSQYIAWDHFLLFGLRTATRRSARVFGNQGTCNVVHPRLSGLGTWQQGLREITGLVASFDYIT